MIHITCNERNSLKLGKDERCKSDSLFEGRYDGVSQNYKCRYSLIQKMHFWECTLQINYQTCKITKNKVNYCSTGHNCKVLENT